MFKCATCGKKPTRQCNSCNQKLLCKECSYSHSDEHLEKNTSCLFGNLSLKLPNENLGNLKKHIEEIFKSIEDQKKLIMNEGFDIIFEIENMMKQDIQELNNMREEYNNLYCKTIFNEEEMMRINMIMEEKPFFKPPFFTKIEGINKNAKISPLESDKNSISIKILESEDGQFFQNNIEEIRSISITRNNKIMILGSYDKTIKVWNILENRLETELLGHTGRVFVVTLTNDDQFVLSGSEDLTVRLWNLQKKKQEALFEGHSNYISILAVTNNDNFAISGDSVDLRVWNLQKKQLMSIIKNEIYNISCIAILGDNRGLIYACHDGSIKIYDFLLFKKIDNPSSILMIRDNLLTSISPYQVFQWDLKNGELQKELVFYNIKAFSKDETILITVSLWKNKYHTEVWNLQKKTMDEIEHSGSFYGGNWLGVIISNDNRYLFLGHNEILVWNLFEKKQEAKLPCANINGKHLAITNDNQFLIVGSYDYTVKMWNIKLKRLEAVFYCSSVHISSLAITSDDRYLILAPSNSTMVIWRIFDKQQEAIFNISELSAIAISYDNEIIVLSCVNSLKIWNLLEKKQEFEIESLGNNAFSIFITKDKKYVLNCFENVYKVWNLQSRKIKLIMIFTDNRASQGVLLSKFENKIYFCNVITLLSLDIETNTMKKEMYFDEKNCNEVLNIEDRLMPHIIYWE